MKRLFVVMAVLALVGMAVPAWAQFPCVWWDNFDWAVGGTNLAGQNGWVLPNLGCASPIVQTTPSPTVSPLHSIRQPVGVRSAIKRPLKAMNGGNVHYRGMVKFWLYDTGGTGSTVDTRVGVFSSASPTAGDSGSMTYVQAVGITSSRPGDCFYVYASSGFIAMDGASNNTAPNYLLSSAGCAPATRIYNAWSSVIIDWTVDPYTNVLHSNYYVNLDYEDPQVNAVLDCSWGADKTGARYNNLRNVAGLFIGSGSAWSKPCYVDDIRFTSYAARNPPPSVPEPSGLVTLSAGLLGLAGLIRRRK